MPGTPPYIDSLLRHFADLRDGTHGGAVTRAAKEAAFTRAAALLAPVSRQVLAEVNDGLLNDTGKITETGPERLPDGGLAATWALTWPEQQAARLPPLVLAAHYGSSFHHPHLRGATVHDWPLNIFNHADAEAQLPVLRAITAADLHNLVFQSDFRIVPAITRQASGR